MLFQLRDAWIHPQKHLPETSKTDKSFAQNDIRKTFVLNEMAANPPVWGDLSPNSLKMLHHHALLCRDVYFYILIIKKKRGPGHRRTTDHLSPPDSHSSATGLISVEDQSLAFVCSSISSWSKPVADAWSRMSLLVAQTSTSQERFPTTCLPKFGSVLTSTSPRVGSSDPPPSPTDR